jgi:chromosome segregation protein
VGPLKEQSEKAKKYIDLAGEKKTLEVGLWLYTLDRRAEALRGQDNSIWSLRAPSTTTSSRAARRKLSAETEQAYLRTQQAAAAIAEEYREAWPRSSKKLQAADAEAQAAVRDSDIRHNRENACGAPRNVKRPRPRERAAKCSQEQEPEKRREELKKLEERADMKSTESFRKLRRSGVAGAHQKQRRAR